MNTNDLHHLWNDALDDVPTEAASEPVWQHIQQGLRAERRRRLLTRSAALAAGVLVAVAAWRYVPSGTNELVGQPLSTLPAPVIAPVATPDTLATPVTSPDLATTPPPATSPGPTTSPGTEPPAAEAAVVVHSVPLKEFLAQLPNHALVEITNERGRVLVVVDNETGETFTTVLSKDEPL